MTAADAAPAASLEAALAHAFELLERRPDLAEAVVSRGGRPDLASAYLERVVAPTLLIVGSADTEVLALNEEAFQLLRGARELAVIPGATHLFEERGALAEVARLAAAWFTRYLAGQALEATA